MKKSVIVPFFILLLQHSYGQKRENILLNAYQTNSTTKANQFFTNWNLESKQLIARFNSSTNDTVINIHNIFQSFYDSIGSRESETKDIAKYFLIPDTITYQFIDTLIKEQFFDGSFLFTAQGSLNYLPENKIYTLHSFYPQLNPGLAKTLSITKSYNDLFSNFLGHKKNYDYYKDKYPNASLKTITLITKSQKESRKRREFLSKYLHLQYEDYEASWQFYSVPFISKIIFDKDFKTALIDYQSKEIGGLAYFKKISGNWHLIELKGMIIID